MVKSFLKMCFWISQEVCQGDALTPLHDTLSSQGPARFGSVSPQPFSLSRPRSSIRFSWRRLFHRSLLYRVFRALKVTRVNGSFTRCHARSHSARLATLAWLAIIHARLLTWGKWKPFRSTVFYSTLQPGSLKMGRTVPDWKKHVPLFLFNFFSLFGACNWRKRTAVVAAVATFSHAKAAAMCR